jgi:hypothetical protein
MAGSRCEYENTESILRSISLRRVGSVKVELSLRIERVDRLRLTNGKTD